MTALYYTPLYLHSNSKYAHRLYYKQGKVGGGGDCTWVVESPSLTYMILLGMRQCQQIMVQILAKLQACIGRVIEVTYAHGQLTVAKCIVPLSEQQPKIHLLPQKKLHTGIEKLHALPQKITLTEKLHIQATENCILPIMWMSV